MDSLSSGIPDEFICPITRELMKDPVIASGMCGDCQAQGARWWGSPYKLIDIWDELKISFFS